MHTVSDPVADFAALQGTLAERPPTARRTVVAFPSINLGAEYAATKDVPALETRWLHLLLHLRDPRARVVVVTSLPVPEHHVDAYLALIPDALEPRRRLTLLDAGDPGSAPLAEKLLLRPARLAQLRAAIGDPEDAYLVPFNVTAEERDVALWLDVPIAGTDPRFAAYGTKTGGRRAFAAAGVAAPFGTDGTGGADALVAALTALRAERPALARVVVKLDEGWLGAGNAILALPADDADLAATVRAGLDATYVAAMEQQGWIVEELIAGEELHSPSVQVLLPADGPPVVQASHDQVLGGPLGHTFAGAVLPADPRYGSLVVAAAERVAAYLADAGVTGRFALDFVVARDREGTWHPYALEINLREGATTHPLGTLALLTGGAFDAATGTFRTAAGEPRHSVFSDGIRAGGPVALDRALATLAAAGLAYDPATQTGVVLHLLGPLEREGWAGATAIAATAAEAQAAFDATGALLGQLARP